MKKVLLTSIFSLSLMIAFSQLVSDDFSYSDGNITANAAWSAHSASGSNAVQVSSNAAVVTHGSGGREDVNTSFSTQSSGTLYYSITFSVDDLGSPISGTDREYFVHFNSGSNFTARLDIVRPSGSGDFSVGIATTSSTADATWATDLNYSTSYTAVVEYNIDQNSTKLWIDPVNEMSTSVDGQDLSGTGNSVSSISLRQSDSSSDETIRVSEIIVDFVFPANPLPVDLISFSAKPMKKAVALEWATASEENNAYFSIEHSTDGQNFTAIDEVEGALDASFMNYYEYMHEDAAKGMNYYRLRQIDTDGTSSLSDVQAVKISSVVGIKARPTLAERDVTIEIEEALSAETTIEVFNILGRIVSVEVLQIGATQLVIDVNGLRKGHYFVRLNNGTDSRTARFIRK